MYNIISQMFILIAPSLSFCIPAGSLLCDYDILPLVTQFKAIIYYSQFSFLLSFSVRCVGISIIRISTFSQ